MSVKPNKVGRPTTYSIEFGKEICQMLQDGTSLKKIGEMPNMPVRSTIHLWLLEHAEFSDMYNVAVNVRTDNMFDELNEIADDTPPEEINKGRLRVDTRKWYLSKVMPKKYGERLDVTSDHKQLSVGPFNYVKPESDEQDNDQSNDPTPPETT